MFFVNKKASNHNHSLFYFINNIAIYPAYINKYTIPFILLISFFGGINGNNAKIIEDTNKTVKSKLYVIL